MDLFRELISVIKALKRKHYLLTGGLAYALYVQPRFTEDIDFVVAEDDFEDIRRRMVHRGFLDQPDNIVVFKKARIGRCVKVKGNDTIMVDFLIRPKNEFNRFYRRCNQISYRGLKIKVISGEDLIKLKRDRFSAQDKLDIERLLKTLRNKVSDEK